MRAIERWSGWGAVLALLLLGCGSEATEPGPVGPGPVTPPAPDGQGRLVVSVQAEGLGPQPAPYHLQVEDKPVRAFGTSETRAEVSAGLREVALVNVPAHCTVADNPRRVEVLAGETRRETFVMRCRGGAIRVTAVTTGEDRDGSGYDMVVADGAAGSSLTYRGALGTDESRLLSGFSSGAEVTVRLLGVALNCRSDRGEQRVTIGDGDTTKVEFAVSCAALVSAPLLIGTGSSMWRVGDDGTVLEVGPGSWPTWSPDGTRMAYVASDGSLVTADPAGAGAVVVARAPDGGPFATSTSWYAPSFAPDGQRLVVSPRPYLSCAWGCTMAFGGIYEARASSLPGAAAPLLAPAVAAASAWLPDNSGLVTTTGYGLQVRPFNGTSRDLTPRGLAGSTGPEDRQPPHPPRLSPDGREVLWTEICGEREYYGELFACGVVVVPIDGRPARRIAGGGVRGLDWSPDGQRVLLHDGQTLYTASPIDGAPAQVIRYTGPAQSASWRR